jgi:hypothetical protein
MNFKKLSVALSLVTLTVFLLGACAPAAPIAVATSAPVAEVAAVAQDTSTSAAVELNATYENAVSIEQQLILGTFKLEGTDLAVSKEQASILVPLYTNLKTVMESMMPAQGTQPQAVNTETQAQIDTIIKDILAAMTPEQVKAISDMQITREIAQSIMTENGISLGGPEQGGTGNPPDGGQKAGANGQPPEGTPPAEGPGGSAGAPPGDGKTGQQPGGGMVPSELINTLIELLQSK